MTTNIEPSGNPGELPEAERLARALQHVRGRLELDLYPSERSAISDAVFALNNQAAEIARLNDELGEVATVAYMQGAAVSNDLIRSLQARIAVLTPTEHS